MSSSISTISVPSFIQSRLPVPRCHASCQRLFIYVKAVIIRAAVWRGGRAADDNVADNVLTTMSSGSKWWWSEKMFHFVKFSCCFWRCSFVVNLRNTVWYHLDLCQDSQPASLNFKQLGVRGSSQITSLNQQSVILNQSEIHSHKLLLFKRTCVCIWVFLLFYLGY